MLHGLFWLTANLAASAPLLLVVDDAQWADQPSLRLLNYLAARLEGLPVGLLVGCRPPDLFEEGALLARLLADPAIEIARPATLTSAGTARLLAERLGQRADELFVDACRVATGGNPFYLRELARSLADQGISPTTEHAGRVVGVRPQSVSRTILTRISSPARELARALAILDEPVELHLAAALADLHGDPAITAADELARAGLVEAHAPLALVHSIVRGAVLSSLSAVERSDWHRRAATLLRERGASTEHIAVHLLVTEPSASPKVVDTLHAAARMAFTRGAPESAARPIRFAAARRCDAWHGRSLPIRTSTGSSARISIARSARSSRVIASSGWPWRKPASRA
ncbi:MAG: hypothetical protein LC790_03815 [Actinobacteria bacterium]|nr:hypothetical protein [Actinomycetota bacterium]